MNRFNNWKEPIFDENGWAYEANHTIVGQFANNKKPYGWRCFNSDNLILGDKCDIASHTLIQAKYGVEIGEHSEIGPFCYISSWSTEDNKKGKVTIGKNTMIGAHSTVMPGITIGDNVIIGAYTFVNKDIPSNCTAYGIPVKIIKVNK